MSGRENNFGGLEDRLRSEPIEGEGLSDMARARLRERLACTAPEPGRPPSALAGRGALIAAVLVIGGVVGAVVVSQRNAAIEAARQIAARAPSAEGATPAREGAASAGDAAAVAALRSERDAAVALALRLQAEAESGEDRLLIAGRGSMTAKAIASTLDRLENERDRLEAALESARATD